MGYRFVSGQGTEAWPVWGFFLFARGRGGGGGWRRSCAVSIEATVFFVVFFCTTTKYFNGLIYCTTTDPSHDIIPTHALRLWKSVHGTGARNGARNATHDAQQRVNMTTPLRQTLAKHALPHKHKHKRNQQRHRLRARQPCQASTACKLQHAVRTPPALATSHLDYSLPVSFSSLYSDKGDHAHAMRLKW